MKGVYVPVQVSAPATKQQWWIRLPDDSDWYRVRPDVGPWWSIGEEGARLMAEELTIKYQECLS